MPEPTLLERLRACELLSAEQIAELERLPEATDPDPKVLARVVLQRGWLTRFQVSQVAVGKGKDLFVGPYVMLDRLGEGGMGQVLKARHRHMKRVVALKLIRKEKLGGADSVARFYQEVEAAAQLHHPNIVLAFDAGQAGGTHFFAMEYVEGPDLTRLVREKGTLPVAQACGFIRQAAIGLQHAHERGLVHRDIKPSNLLVTASAAEPVVKILDLGLARLGDSFAKERNLTKMGQVIGTPDYLAPEQALDARNVDIRADIYSLGCSLYFLLTARAPFEAESLTELLMKHQMNDPTPIRSLRPDVPPALEALLRRMLAKKAQDRPATPAEVAEALEPFARGEQGGGAAAPPPVSIAAPAAPRGEETWAGLSNDGEVVARPKVRASRSRDTIDEEPRPRRKREKGNKGLLIGGAVGAGVLVVALIGLVIAVASSKKPEKVVEKKPTAQGTQGQQVPPKDVVVPPAEVEVVQPADPPAVGALAAIDRGVRQGKMTRTAMVGGGDGGTEEYADLGADGALLTGLEVGIGKWGTQDVVHYLRPVYGSGAARTLGKAFGAKQERTFRFDAKPGYAVSGLTINAGAGLDGLSVQFMPIKGTVLDPADSYEEYWVGGKGGRRRKLGGDGSPVVGLFGKLSRVPPLVANGLGLVQIARAAPGDPPTAPNAPARAEVRRFAPPDGGRYTAVFFHPDGRQGVALVGPVGLTLDPATGAQKEAFRAGGGDVYAAASAKDGKQLLRADADRRLRLIDVQSGTVAQTFHDETYETLANGVALSSDGKLALSAANGAPTTGPGGAATTDIILWDVNTGKTAHRFGGSDIQGRSCAFTDDGLYVVAAHHKLPLRVWDVKTKKLLHTVEGPGPGLKGATHFAPAGGSELLVSCDDGTMLVYDCATGKEVRTFAGPRVRDCQGIALTADFKRAVTISGFHGAVNGELMHKDAAMRVWDYAKGVEVARVDLPTTPRFLALSPDGKSALVGDEKLIRYFHLTRLAPKDGPKPPDTPVTPKREAVRFEGHAGRVYRVAVSPDGKYLLSCGEDCSVRLWDAASGKSLRTFYGVNKKVAIRDVCFTRDGAGLLALDAGMTVYHWNSADPGFLTSTASGGPRPPSGSPVGFALSGAGDCLAVASGKSLVLVRLLPEGKLVASTKLTLRNAAAGSIASAEGVARTRGEWFVLGDVRGSVLLADLSSAAPKIVSETPASGQKVSALAYDSVTGHLISAESGRTIKVTVFRAGAGATSRTTSAHQGAVTCLAVSPGGTRFASGGQDKTVRVWDMKTLKEVQKFTEEDEIVSVAFAKDGKGLYVAGTTLRLLPLGEAKKKEGKESEAEEKP